MEQPELAEDEAEIVAEDAGNGGEIELSAENGEGADERHEPQQADDPEAAESAEDAA